eukprot:COSAG01_NODE_28301_length_664_cov_1.228319_1_plen_164_part_00
MNKGEIGHTGSAGLRATRSRAGRCPPGVEGGACVRGAPAMCILGKPPALNVGDSKGPTEGAREISTAVPARKRLYGSNSSGASWEWTQPYFCCAPCMVFEAVDQQLDSAQNMHESDAREEMSRHSLGRQLASLQKKVRRSSVESVPPADDQALQAVSNHPLEQ